MREDIKKQGIVNLSTRRPAGVRNHCILCRRFDCRAYFCQVVDGGALARVRLPGFSFCIALFRGRTFSWQVPPPMISQTANSETETLKENTRAKKRRIYKYSRTRERDRAQKYIERQTKQQTEKTDKMQHRANTWDKAQRDKSEEEMQHQY